MSESSDMTFFPRIKYFSNYLRNLRYNDYSMQKPTNLPYIPGMIPAESKFMITSSGASSPLMASPNAAAMPVSSDMKAAMNRPGYARRIRYDTRFLKDLQFCPLSVREPENYSSIPGVIRGFKHLSYSSETPKGIPVRMPPGYEKCRPMSVPEGILKTAATRNAARNGRTTYDPEFLLKQRFSFMSVIPPHNLPVIPGIALFSWMKNVRVPEDNYAFPNVLPVPYNLATYNHYNFY